MKDYDRFPDDNASQFVCLFVCLRAGAVVGVGFTDISKVLVEIKDYIPGQRCINNRSHGTSRDSGNSQKPSFHLGQPGEAARTLDQHSGGRDRQKKGEDLFLTGACLPLVSQS